MLSGIVVFLVSLQIVMILSHPAMAGIFRPVFVNIEPNEHTFTTEHLRR